MNEMTITSGAGLVAIQVGDMYTSLPNETKQDKAFIYNASNNPKHRIGDFVNKQIKVKDVIIEKIEMQNERTQEMQETPRTILIDENGESYVAVSVGIANAVAKTCNLFGMPNEWDEPVVYEVKQIEKQGKRLFTLEMVF